MLQINNKTPFEAEIHPVEDIYGRDYAVVIIKATFNTDQKRQGLMLADEQVKIQHADEFYGEPGLSSVKYGTDLALAKTATDIILIGNGYAPGGVATEAFDISLSIGEHQTSLRAFGDRQWHKNGLLWEISRPQKLEKIELIYENAFGGIEPQKNDSDDSSALAFESKNPVGKGFFVGKNSPNEGLLLPNLEDPRSLIKSIDCKPSPVGFGVIARDWAPRREYAGTFDDEWERSRMPLLPMDFDPRFYNNAHPNLIISPEIKGNELVTIQNANESGHYSFQLPGQQIVVNAKIRNQQADFVAKFDTLVIEPDLNQLMLTWRVAIPCKRKFLYLDQVTIKGH